MSANEKFQLQTVRDTVDTNTFHKSLQDLNPLAAARVPRTSQGPMRPALDQATREDNRERDYQQRKQDRKAFRRHEKQIQDELVPKPDPGSREAQLEKRRQKGAYAHQERDSMPEMREYDLMGGGARSEFQQQLQHRERRFQRKANNQNVKAAEAVQKERNRMDALLGSLGMDRNTYR